jgi:hypothetical protein
MIPPQMPFHDYKWRWASVELTESLNDPAVFLGCLRVLWENRGRKPNSPEVTSGLDRVERELKGRVSTRLRLVRPTEDRNIFRNSQQYWKALGVLQDTRGTRGIILTPFGDAVADGRVTQVEFSTTIVATLELPNRAIMNQQEIERWDSAGLRIRPLLLILEVMRKLGARFGEQQAFLTCDELIRIVIPLAGDRTATMNEYIDSISAFRNGHLSFQGWPNCAPESNDRRMAREFLLFLSHYGFCSYTKGATNSQDCFAIQEGFAADLQAIVELPAIQIENRMQVAEQVRETGAAVFVERQRTMRPVLQRPQQSKFRRDVLGAYMSECLITHERIPETLEAAHIIPVEYRGPDSVGNGICLRSDIHSLFDSGHLRINPHGQLVFSGAVRSSANYRNLPPQIHVPQFLLTDALEWRWRYQ